VRVSRFDAMIATLSPLLEDGDLLIDGGKLPLHRPRAAGEGAARGKELSGFIRLGVSGGAKGAGGPSIDARRHQEAYDAIEGPLCGKYGCQVEDGPCALHRPGGAGTSSRRCTTASNYASSRSSARL